MEDKQFGIPEQKKFPLDSRAHVISAVRFFNYCPPKYERALASRIIRKIHEYGITSLTPSDDNRFYNYYHPESVQHSDDYVAHHQRLGARWGHYNGPPYPLDSKTAARVTKGASKEERAAARARNSGGNGKQSWGEKRKAKKVQKQRQQNLERARQAKQEKAKAQAEHDRIVKRGSAEEAFKIRDSLTEAEKNQILNRLRLDEQLGQYASKGKKSKLDRFGNAVNKVANGLDTAAKISTSINTLKKNLGGDSSDQNEFERVVRSGDARKLMKYKGKLSSKQWTEAANIIKQMKTVNDEVSRLDAAEETLRKNKQAAEAQRKKDRQAQKERDRQQRAQEQAERERDEEYQRLKKRSAAYSRKVRRRGYDPTIITDSRYLLG